MMRDITEKKRGSILSAAVAAGFLLLFIAAFAAAVLCEDVGAFPIVLVYAIGIGAVVIGIFAALRQRLKELDGGEEENARQY